MGMSEYERALSKLSMSLRVLRKQLQRQRWGDAGISLAATLDRADVVSRIKKESVAVGSKPAMAGVDGAIMDLYRHLTLVDTHIASKNHIFAVSHAEEATNNVQWLFMAAEFVDLHPMPGEESQ
jgi:hypothetical protein